ncbi:MAG: presqualene diphosphate synthase HpnD [Magnetovibrionaceae bacterium]
MTTFTQATTEQARDHVEAVTRASKTSFFRAMDRLPEPKRGAMFAVYAFCREVDDIADGELDLPEKRTALARWREAVDGLYLGRAESLTGQALLDPISAYGLRKEDFLAVIDGMERDADEPVRIQSREDLETYCDQVACAVGRLSNRIFGAPAEHADAVAFALGQALQLTNILRDIVEDAGRDRLYLPADALAAAGVPSGPAVEVIAHPGLKPVCMGLSALAGQRFREADSALAFCDPEVMKPARMMQAAYWKILERLNQRGWTRLDERVSLSTMEKLTLALKFGLG